MVNKCILMGRLTRDPELRHTATNTPVTSFTLAIDRNVKRTNDNAQQTVDFFDIVAWDQKAEFATKWFHKGQLVAVVGRLQSRKWQDNQGQNRTTIEVLAEELHFAEGKRDSDTSYASQPVYNNAPYAQPAQKATNSQPVRPALDAEGFESLSDDNSELPF